ncbi:MAG TPA: hypothetical protein VIX86_07910 [Streptosporangiaceae bacterium]
MIRIRYADLPEGLFARAEAQGRHTIIYLRPGLTAAQRKEALRRARRSGRMGYGPRLPAMAVQLAVAADQVRVTLGYTTAAVRQHLLSSLLLAGVMTTAVICYVLFVSVSIRFIHPPTEAEYRHLAPHPAAAPFRPFGSAGPSRPRPGRPGSSGLAAPPSQDQPSPESRSSAPAPYGTGSGSPGPSSSRTPGPSPSPSPTSSGVCLVVGPLGVCLQV